MKFFSKEMLLENLNITHNLMRKSRSGEFRISMKNNYHLDKGKKLMEKDLKSLHKKTKSNLTIGSFESLSPTNKTEYQLNFKSYFHKNKLLLDKTDIQMMKTIDDLNTLTLSRYQLISLQENSGNSFKRQTFSPKKEIVNIHVNRRADEFIRKKTPSIRARRPVITGTAIRIEH